MNTSEEVMILKDAIKEYGSVNSEGKYSVSYGVLFDKTANTQLYLDFSVFTVEALNGTLRAAKRQKKVAFDAELLMMPKDKDVQVVLLDAD
ncbi:costars domain-containing protein [Lentinula aciculospora]|uniref:Costars domain-containing protein n=1 Tax=Lentinula aciculospora TaxID=153920 RepID=A0A9W9AP42_9AGAR|nr:costars domain-containing protein [Lentinula aciculospora]